MIIDTTTDQIHVFLSGTVLTSQLDICAAYNTITTTSLTPGKIQNTTNNLNPVVILPAPNSGEQNQLRFCSIFNSDTKNATVTVEYSGNTGRSIVFVGSIDPNYSIQFNHDKGWRTFSSQGQEKVIGMIDAPGDLRYPPNLKPNNITTTLTIVSGTDYGFYLGKADIAYSNIKIQYNVTSNPASITWAELAIYKTFISLGSGTTDIQYCGFADVSGVINSTGVKTTTVNVTGITENDDLFVVFGAVFGSGTYSIRGGLNDQISTASLGTVTGSLRPSTNTTLSLTTQSGTTCPWVAWQPSQW